MSRITNTAQKTRKQPKRKSKIDAKIKFGTSEHIISVLDILNDLYGGDDLPRDGYATGEPLDGLMLTLLSQNTNDHNRDIAYERLRKAYPTWQDVVSLPQQQIEEAIRPAGLGETKASRMKAALEKIRDDFGCLSLNALRDMRPDEVRGYLCSIDGIGPKTAACVMVFDLCMTAFPVDTHVARLSKRFGFASAKDTPEKIQSFLESIVPEDRCMGGHLNMIHHGRATCRARSPMCEACAASCLCMEFLLRDA